jgi:hypothetical protein
MRHHSSLGIEASFLSYCTQSTLGTKKKSSQFTRGKKENLLKDRHV